MLKASHLAIDVVVKAALTHLGLVAEDHQVIEARCLGLNKPSYIDKVLVTLRIGKKKYDIDGEVAINARKPFLVDVNIFNEQGGYEKRSYSINKDGTFDL